MKIKEVKVAFVEDNRRPEVCIIFDETLEEANNDFIFEAKHDKQFDTWLYRADNGDCVSCIVETPKAQRDADHQTVRLKMKDGTHLVHQPVPSNGPSINRTFPNRDPVMDVTIEQGDRYLWGHVNALAVARVLGCSGQGLGVACVQWPSGLRVYEVVRVPEESAQTQPNREGDTIVFLAVSERQGNTVH